MAKRQAATWGAKGKAKLEDDDLFKAIGGQLGGDSFDYTQWQRTANKTPPKDSPTSSQKAAAVVVVGKPAGSVRSAHSAGGVKRPDTTLTTFSTTSGGGATLASLRRIGSASTCHHGHRRTEPKKTLSPLEEAERKKKIEHIKILQLRIRARKQTLAEYRKRYHELIDENIKLKDNIDSGEGESHNDVKKLLRKYEKFRGGIATLNEKFIEELDRVKSDLEKTRFRTELDLAGLQQRANKADKKLKAKQKELNVLVNYKDKEYPLKSLRISELQKEITELKVINQHLQDSREAAIKEEINELQHIVDSELDKYRKQRHKVHKDITEEVSTEFIAKMHPTWQEMSQQNLVMAKEIEYHKKEFEEQEEIVQALDAEVKQLLRDPKTDIRQQMFPQFYPSTQKCTPDMDVVLDIPTHQWLPI